MKGFERFSSERGHAALSRNGLRLHPVTLAIPTTCACLADASSPLLPGGSLEAQTASHGAAADGSACSTATAERPLKARPASGGTPAAADAAAAAEASGALAGAAEPGGLSRTSSARCAPAMPRCKQCMPVHHSPGWRLGQASSVSLQSAVACNILDIERAERAAIAAVRVLHGNDLVSKIHSNSFTRISLKRECDVDMRPVARRARGWCGCAALRPQTLRLTRTLLRSGRGEAGARRAAPKPNSRDYHPHGWLQGQRSWRRCAALGLGYEPDVCPAAQRARRGWRAARGRGAIHGAAAPGVCHGAGDDAAQPAGRVCGVPCGCPSMPALCCTCLVY